MKKAVLLGAALLAALLSGKAGFPPFRRRSGKTRGLEPLDPHEDPNRQKMEE
jgi:hypothetical protein